MLGINPSIILLFCILFIALGIYNILLGQRRRRQMGAQETQKRPWYAQINILTGIEYILLSVAFLLNIGISSHWLPASLNTIVVPFYLVVIVASGILAGMVIFQGIRNVRRRTAAPQPVGTANMSAASAYENNESDPQAQARIEQKRREHRRKAALNRRRRAGKA